MAGADMAVRLDAGAPRDCSLQAGSQPVLRLGLQQRRPALLGSPALHRDHQYVKRLQFVSLCTGQEDQHISFISNAISASGATPNQACQYSFPFYDVKSWLTLTQTIDGVGPNAYLGASGLLSNKQTLTYAASILTVESRHNTWVRSAAQNEDGFPTPFEQPLTVNQVYTLASAFITSCPSSNAPLKAQAFPALTVSPNGTAQPGDTLTLTANTTLPSSGLYAVFLANNAPVAVQTDGKSVQVPSQQAVQGQTVRLFWPMAV